MNRQQTSSQDKPRLSESATSTPGPLARPLIIVGTGRCGSTIFFEALSHHQDFGWLTNYDAKLPRSKPAQLTHYARRSKLLDRLLVTEKLQNRSKWRSGEKYLIRPEEGYTKWNLLCGRDFGCDYLLNQTATAEAAQRIRDFFQVVLRKQRKSRLPVSYTHLTLPTTPYV